MSKEEDYKKLEETGKRIDNWSKKNLVKPNYPECPICSGIIWVWNAEEINFGPFKACAKHCSSCGYIIFINSQLIT